ncbi:hypothetical protein PMNALOAF_4231 [Methylobacterium adhaesivum]|nr:hypothetical protein PMNALOAF_4231 [Methylobacterium adhaesivum]
MVDGVADDVQQWLEQVLDDPPIRLRLLAGDFQDHILAEATRGFAHRPREAAEHLRQRREAERDHVSVQRCCEAADIGIGRTHRPGEGAGLLARLGPGREVAEGVAGHDEFAHESHERIDPAGIDPQGAGRIRAVDLDRSGTFLDDGR